MYTKGHKPRIDHEQLQLEIMIEMERVMQHVREGYITVVEGYDQLVNIMHSNN